MQYIINSISRALTVILFLSGCGLQAKRAGPQRVSGPLAPAAQPPQMGPGSASAPLGGSPSGGSASGSPAPGGSAPQGLHSGAGDDAKKKVMEGHSLKKPGEPGAPPPTTRLASPPSGVGPTQGRPQPQAPGSNPTGTGPTAGREQPTVLPTAQRFQSCRTDGRVVVNEDKDLYKMLNQAFYKSSAKLLDADQNGQKNLFISSLNFNMALAMLMAGGREQTFEELACYLGFHEDNFKTEAATRAVFERIKSIHSKLNRKNDQTGGQLTLANSIWSREKQFFLPTYAATVSSYFGAEAKTYESYREINKWVEDKTNSMIKDLLSQDMDAAVLIATAYFKENWKYKFDSVTADVAPDVAPFARFFNSRNQELQDRPFMEVKASFKGRISFLETKDPNNPNGGSGNQAALDESKAQFVVLPYADGKTQMEILLPPKSTPANKFLSGLTLQQHSQYLGEVREQEIRLVMPKLDLGYRVELIDVLKQLGVSTVFGLQADLGLMTNISARVDKIIHQTALKADESGTKAAAATAVIIVEKSIRASAAPPLLVINRPFLVFIRDVETSLILFGGVVEDPMPTKASAQ